MKKHDPSQYYQSYLYIGCVWFTIVLIMFFLTSCSGTYYVVEQPQHTCELMERGDACLSDHRCCETQEHSTEVYYHNELPYWGFYSGYYYYYGVPHYYPWWYYYTLRPHYTYGIHTHVYIHCNNGYYVSKPRGTRFNNGKNRTYKPNKTITVKSNRNNNRTIIKTNKNRTNIKVNTNRTNIKTNTNRNNIKINKNSNIKNNLNRSNKNRTNIKINRNNSNKSNNKTFNNRSNKTNIRTKTRKPR
jgi:hypothetical protein